MSIPQTDGTRAELPTTDNQAIGFIGYLKDPESGLYYAKARYYDPRIARFATQDPEEGNVMQPPSLHLYLYAYANPTVFVDPTGRLNYLTDVEDTAKASVASYDEVISRLAVGILPQGFYVANIKSKAAIHCLLDGGSEMVTPFIFIDHRAVH